jgi:fused signal recognition particle receptor
MASDFAGRLRNFFGLRRTISEELFEELEDLLVEGDFGPAEACAVTDKLRERCRAERIAEAGAVRELLAELLTAELLAVKLPTVKLPAAASGDRASPFVPGELTVILLLGVNGVGKTTTAAKLASRFRTLYRRRPILAAADTFRAAAADQLRIHGERLGLRVVAHKQGGDPAAVIYDAVEAARAGGGDCIIADTAGRMHTKAALVEELKKIDRVIKSRAGGGPCLKWLVLDATTGRNALVQAETFHGALALDAVILTKFDSGARGGVVFSLARSLGLPVAFVCDGEKYGDIRDFDPRRYAREFAGFD